MKTYKRQNKLQQTLSLIFPNKSYRDLINKKEVGFYTPKLNKLKLALCSLLVVGCLITPATNWLIVFIIGWLLK